MPIIGNNGKRKRKKIMNKKQEMLDIALMALERYACDIQIQHNPVFAKTALMKIYAQMHNKELHIGDQVEMPTFKCKNCKETFVSLRKDPTCPYCSGKSRKVTG